MSCDGTWRRYRTPFARIESDLTDSLVLALEGEVDQLAELEELELPEVAMNLAVRAAARARGTQALLIRK